MPLAKKKNAAPPASEPTLAERLDAALLCRAGAEGLVSTGASGLSAAAAELSRIAQDAFDEASRLSILGNQATAHAAQADERSAAAIKLLG